MKKFIFFFPCVLLLAMLNACSGENSNETVESSTAEKQEVAEKSTDEKVKSYILNNIDYDLYDLSVEKEETEEYAVVGTLGTDYKLRDFAAFARELSNISYAAANEFGIAVKYVNPKIYTGDDKWIGWSNDTGNICDQDGILAENIALEKLSIEIDKIVSLNSIDRNKFGDMLDAFQGEWKLQDKDWHLIISGEKIDGLRYSNYGDEVDSSNHDMYKFDIDESRNLIVIERYFDKTKKATMTINESGQLVEHEYNVYGSKGAEFIYDKVSDNTALPPIYEKSSPKIGMTESEVFKSTWGSPKKYNRTTTVGGEREQWVYDEGYIYFQNGRVIAIQER